MRKFNLFKLTLFFSVTALIATFGFRIYVCNKYVATGNEIQSLESEIATLNRENEVIKERIVTETSLSKIKDKALSMGMQQPLASEFLTPPTAAQADSDTSGKF